MEAFVRHIETSANDQNRQFADTISARIFDEIEALKSQLQQDRDTDQYQAFKQENTDPFIETGTRKNPKEGLSEKADTKFKMILKPFHFLEATPFWNGGSLQARRAQR